uniref:DNA-directed RNA polymerase III subunit, putative n=1 Tax=Arundo donax TaxID=35708 RepID=A0A0A9HDR9_ARUDO
MLFLIYKNTYKLSNFARSTQHSHNISKYLRLPMFPQY